MTNDSVLVVDKKTRRFWALLDVDDGTLFCVQIATMFADDHDEVPLYTSAAIATKAAHYETATGAGNLIAVEVQIVRAQR